MVVLVSGVSGVSGVVFGSGGGEEYHERINESFSCWGWLSLFRVKINK